MSDLNFDNLEPIYKELSIGGEPHVVCEASAAAAVRWRDVAIRGAKMIDGKVTGMDDIAKAEPLLVSECLYTKAEWDRGDKKQHVKLDKVLPWPNRVTSGLFDWIKANSPGLEGKETKESLEKKKAEIDAKIKEMEPAAVEEAEKNS